MKTGNNIAIEVYPNPVDDILSLVVSGVSDQAVVLLTDLSGRSIATMNLKNGHADLNTVGLAPGMYLISLTGEISTRYIKVIKR